MRSSKFTEILNPAEAPTYTHPHLNVSLEDILAEQHQNQNRNSSHSSASSSTSASSRKSADSDLSLKLKLKSNNAAMPPPQSPTSPTSEVSKMLGLGLRRRGFTLGSKKGKSARGA